MCSLLKNRQALSICFFLAALTIPAFLQLDRCDFINFDDPSYVSENVHIQNGVTLEAVRWAFTTTYQANWHPLTWMSHMLDVQLFGFNPRGHHLTNLFFHVANTILLFLIFCHMTKAPWKSAFVAALFAIHPLHVESVAWVAERKDVLSTFFWMLTVGAYVHYVEHPRLRNYLAVPALFVLGLMAKPMLVTLPFVLLLLDFWPLQRLQGAGSMEQAARSESQNTDLEREPLCASKRKRKCSPACCSLPLRCRVRRSDRHVPRGRWLVELRAPHLQRVREFRRRSGAHARLHHYDRHIGFLRAALPRSFWPVLKVHPWDSVGGIVTIVVLVAINIVGIKEAARLTHRPRRSSTSAHRSSWLWSVCSCCCRRASCSTRSTSASRLRGTSSSTASRSERSPIPASRRSRTWPKRPRTRLATCRAPSSWCWSLCLASMPPSRSSALSAMPVKYNTLPVNPATGRTVQVAVVPVKSSEVGGPCAVSADADKARLRAGHADGKSFYIPAQKPTGKVYTVAGQEVTNLYGSRSAASTCRTQCRASWPTCQQISAGSEGLPQTVGRHSRGDHPTSSPPTPVSSASRASPTRWPATSNSPPSWLACTHETDAVGRHRHLRLGGFAAHCAGEHYLPRQVYAFGAMIYFGWPACVSWSCASRCPTAGTPVPHAPQHQAAWRAAAAHRPDRRHLYVCGLVRGGGDSRRRACRRVLLDGGRRTHLRGLPQA